MILKTKVPVTFNKPMSGTESEVIIGTLTNRVRKGSSYFGANYVLGLETGAILQKKAFELKTKEEIVALNALIKDDLPVYEDSIEPEFEELKCYLAFRLEIFKLLLPMNEDLTIEDVEIVPGAEVEFK